MADEVVEKEAFARTYRPTTLDGYIGNKVAKETLKNYLRNGRPQTILLQGNSGCGKTTLARLIAKEYLCENWTAEKGACDQCSTCLMMDEYITTGKSDGLTNNIFEIDASVGGKTDEMRNLIESFEAPTIDGSWKIYIIDEAHLMTRTAMGDLLKPFEEPPEKVLIILCTTDPDKLLDTLRNRCQLKLAVSKPTVKELTGLLRNVCKSEGKNYDMRGLTHIANHADCVIRAALSDLETVINTCGDAVDESVGKVFHEVSTTYLKRFYETYLHEDYAGYADLLYRVKSKMSFEQFVDALTNYTVRGLYISNGVNVDGLSKGEITEYKELFKGISPARVSQILSSLRRMKSGNIESNLMAFIYEPVGIGMTKLEREAEEVEDAEEALKKEKKEKTVTIGKKEEKRDKGSINESNFRNDNVNKLREAELQKMQDEAPSQNIGGYSDTDELISALALKKVE